MVIENVIGNIKDYSNENMEIDVVSIDWYEVDKKILHKKSRSGVEIGFRNNKGTPLNDGDILYRDGNKIMVIEILECLCIGLKPKNMEDISKASYEIGNRHAPLFWENEELLTPFDEPLMNTLNKFGFEVLKKNAKLKRPIGGNSNGHGHTHSH